MDWILGYDPPADKFQVKMDKVAAGTETYKVLNEAYAKNPKDVPTVFKLARKWSDRYGSDQAKTLYKEVLALDPQNKAGLYTPEGENYEVGYAEYFLIFADIVRWANQHGIEVVNEAGLAELASGRRVVRLSQRGAAWAFVAAGAALAAGRAKAAVGRARDLLERLGLGARAGAFPFQLSGGERQRVAVARALINGPDLLLCDEPTGNLDRDHAEEVATLILELAAAQGATVLIATHDLALAARCGRRLALNHGRTEEVGA